MIGLIWIALHYFSASSQFDPLFERRSDFKFGLGLLLEYFTRACLLSLLMEVFIGTFKCLDVNVDGLFVDCDIDFQRDFNQS